MSIGFRRMVDGCEVIAVARFPAGTGVPENGHRVELELVRILKGDVKPGKHKVTFTDRPWAPTDGSKFVAFFRKGLCWRFVARPLARDGALGDSVLSVGGFYDWNAYLVSPGLVTFNQIETYIKNRALQFTFRGPLYFPKRGQVPWERSPLELEVTYDAVTGRSAVKGLPDREGFPEHFEVGIGGFRSTEGRIRLTCHPLEIGGEVHGLDHETGVMQTRFFVEEPDVTSREELETFLADPHLGSSYYRCKITLAPRPGDAHPKALTLTLNDTPGDGMGRLEGWRDHPLVVERIEYKGPNFQSTALRGNLPPRLAALLQDSDRETTYRFFLPLSGEDHLLLQFDIGPPPDGELIFGKRHDASRALLYTLLTGEVKGIASVYAHGDIKDEASFTASLDGTYFLKMDRPRTVPGNPSRVEGGSDPEEQWDAEDYADCEHAARPSRSVAAGAILVTLLGLASVVLVWRLWKRRAAGARQG
jgi:hypothetical protein